MMQRKIRHYKIKISFRKICLGNIGLKQLNVVDTIFPDDFVKVSKQFFVSTTALRLVKGNDFIRTAHKRQKKSEASSSASYLKNAPAGSLNAVKLLKRMEYKGIIRLITAEIAFIYCFKYRIHSWRLSRIHR